MPNNSQTEKIITITKDADYPAEVGEVGDIGTLQYEVVEENDKLCRIKILDINVDNGAENSGDAFQRTFAKKGTY